MIRIKIADQILVVIKWPLIAIEGRDADGVHADVFAGVCFGHVTGRQIRNYIYTIYIIQSVLTPFQ